MKTESSSIYSIRFLFPKVNHVIDDVVKTFVLDLHHGSSLKIQVLGAKWNDLALEQLSQGPSQLTDPLLLHHLEKVGHVQLVLAGVAPVLCLAQLSLSGGAGGQGSVLGVLAHVD